MICEAEICLENVHDRRSLTKRVEIIDKREFITVALNADNKIFMVHVATLVEPTTMLIHPFC